LFRQETSRSIFVAKSRLVQATERFGDCLIVVHLQEDLMRSYERCGLSNAAAEARDALMESRSHLLASLSELDRAQRETKQTV
jgi:hypothetical protein